MTDIEERLRTELAELADWFTDEPMACAETSTPANRSHSSRWPLVAAACAALIAGAVGASVLVDGSGRDVSSFASTEVPVGGSAQPAGPAGTRLPLVLEGETVLSESPLTVAGARAPALAVAPDA